MTVENNVERSLFNEVMVPCYNPMEMIPVKGKAHAYGTNKAESISTLLVVLL